MLPKTRTKGSYGGKTVEKAGEQIESAPPHAKASKKPPKKSGVKK